jgi:hypothetical protein
MQRLKNIFLSIFISLEFTSCIFLFVLFIFYEFPFEWIGNTIKSNGLLNKAFYVPLGLLGFISYRFKDLILPSHQGRKKLIVWDDYQRYKDTNIIGISFIILGVLITSVFSFLNLDVSMPVLGLGISIAYFISVISFVSMYFASIKVEELLEMYV